MTASTAISTSLRLRKVSTDISTSIYQRQYLYGASTTVQGARSTGTSYDLGGVSGNKTYNVFDICYPSSSSVFVGTYLQVAKADSGSNEIFFHGIGTTSTVDADGFNIIASSGTITGSVSVYGYNK